MDYLLVVLGLVGLYIGGEGLVRGSVALAQRAGLSQLLIGLTIVGFGTSTPELIVSLQAAFAGSPDIAIGNVLGSNIANVLLILAIGALITPVLLTSRHARRNGVVMVLASAVLFIPMAMGELDRLTGVLLLAGLTLYLVLSYRFDSIEPAAAAPAEDVPHLRQPRLAPLAIVLGIVFLVVGARLLVDGAVSIARDIGISEAAIGLSVVAVGTSLPELAATIVAAARRHYDVVVGNIVGSSIFNVLGILGATAAIAPIPVADRFLHTDLPIATAVVVALAVALFVLRRLGRTAGIVMLMAYGAYLALLA